MEDKDGFKSDEGWGVERMDNLGEKQEDKAAVTNNNGLGHGERGVEKSDGCQKRATNYLVPIVYSGEGPIYQAPCLST